MKFLIALLFVSSFAHAEAGQYRGYRLAENILGERMLEPGRTLGLGNYLPGINGLALISTMSLLGTNERLGAGQHEFRNGQPNTINMLLWYLVLNGFAEQTGKSCVADQGLPLSNSFRAALMDVCAWPEAKAKTETVLQNFWLALMGYDAPESEYKAWRDFFLRSGFASASGEKTVGAMTLAILYNPHFLLNK